MAQIPASPIVGIGEWVRAELAKPGFDPIFAMRVIIKEISELFRSSGLDAQLVIIEKISEPPQTGSPQWNAFLEGIVAYQCSMYGIRPPKWTKRTVLDVGWNPMDDSEFPSRVDWALRDTFDTPAPILEKGITLSRRNLVVV